MESDDIQNINEATAMTSSDIDFPNVNVVNF